MTETLESIYNKPLLDIQNFLTSSMAGFDNDVEKTKLIATVVAFNNGLLIAGEDLYIKNPAFNNLYMSPLDVLINEASTKGLYIQGDSKISLIRKLINPPQISQATVSRTTSQEAGLRATSQEAGLRATSQEAGLRATSQEAGLSAADEEMMGCVFEKIQPYMPIQFLDRGFQGNVYTTCKAADCRFVLKTIISKTPDEFKDFGSVSEKAGILGVGPKVHVYGKCRLNNGQYVHYAVMDKLSGPSLEDKFPYVRNDIKRALNLYAYLFQRGIAQSDLKGSNVMMNNGRMYIIDYGLGKYLMFPDNITEAFLIGYRTHMIAIGELLIKSMTYEYQRFGGKDTWIKSDTLTKTTAITTLKSAVNDWLTEKFPTLLPVSINV